VTSLILLLAGAALLATMLTIHAILRAPLGHEDEDGFHAQGDGASPRGGEAPVPHHGIWAER
jgi:hypothetical protein